VHDTPFKAPNSGVAPVSVTHRSPTRWTASCSSDSVPAAVHLPVAEAHDTAESALSSPPGSGVNPLRWIAQRRPFQRSASTTVWADWPENAPVS
jgi:hypothetical protein